MLFAYIGRHFFYNKFQEINYSVFNLVNYLLMRRQLDIADVEKESKLILIHIILNYSKHKK